jgi:hypothetical protein
MHCPLASSLQLRSLYQARSHLAAGTMYYCTHMLSTPRQKFLPAKQITGLIEVETAFSNRNLVI